MTIGYEFGDGLYVNLTNRCDCACVFCIRHADGKAIFHNDLWLPVEPIREEALADLQRFDLSTYAELVFCGYGEPSYRIDDILWLCDRLRETQPKLPPIRLNTNGHGSLLNDRNIAPELAGRLDRVSISLNASNVADYCILTRPRQGEATWDAMLAFTQEAAKYVPEVVLTIVDCDTPEEEIAACRALAVSLGVTLRVRSYSE